MNAYEIFSNDNVHSRFEQQSKRYTFIGEGFALVADLQTKVILQKLVLNHQLVLKKEKKKKKAVC